MPSRYHARAGPRKGFRSDVPVNHLVDIVNYREQASAMSRGSESSVELDACVEGVRRFNRFYTRRIGVLQEHLLDSSLSLTEARVLYELARGDGVTATEVGGELGLDPGYLSRILRGFRKRGWIERKTAKEDGRRQLLWLTRSGRAAFEPLNARSDAQVRELLAPISVNAQGQLLRAMESIEHALEAKGPAQTPYLLRTHRPGDLGWVVYRHGVLYSQEYGYDERFEALVAGIVAEFVQRFDPDRERCWIAEVDGERVGSVFLVKKSKQIAKLRLLLVEPSARGLGIGKRLVEECVRLARQCRYRKLVLWTQSELKAARRIYEQAGFRMTGSERHQSWGRDDLAAQTWELDL
jgi:DNA-binding MarR family transcriptional regulator/N-acetylglutamate synthase-like GNAT family acetyltransferase